MISFDKCNRLADLSKKAVRPNSLKERPSLMSAHPAGFGIRISLWWRADNCAPINNQRSESSLNRSPSR
jgi:hypothetical protein